MKSMWFLGQGPYRVWKNRLKGGTFGVWSNKYKNDVPGVTWDFWAQFEQFDRFEELRQFRPALFKALPKREAPV